MTRWVGWSLRLRGQSGWRQGTVADRVGATLRMRSTSTRSSGLYVDNKSRPICHFIGLKPYIITRTQACPTLEAYGFCDLGPTWMSACRAPREFDCCRCAYALPLQFWNCKRKEGGWGLSESTRISDSPPSPKRKKKKRPPGRGCWHNEGAAGTRIIHPAALRYADEDRRNSSW